MECLDGLKLIPDESIDCIVTSPPYWKGFEYEAYFNSYKQYLDWSKKWMKECKRVLKPNGYLFFRLNSTPLSIAFSINAIFNSKGFTIPADGANNPFFTFFVILGSIFINSSLSNK